ncbi:MAG: carboxypeptidase M32 [Actinomycetota bacterium]|nr:carboxypeptidase M32 [Actinomycetota bacterium]
MSATWDQIVERLRELSDLASAIKLLHWDQATMMPPAGGAARARAQATLQATAHARFVDPEMGALIAKLSEESLSEEQEANLRLLRRDYDKAVRVPQELVRELAEVSGQAYQAWTEARPAADFSILEPRLSRLVELKKQEAEALGYDNEPYDALLDQYEPGMTTAEVEEMFKGLLAGLKPLVDEVLDNVSDPPGWLGDRYDPDRQMAFCQWLVGQLNFDVSEGRLDVSPHPFTIHIGPGDVRQTTRPDPHNLMMSVYAAVHETGHALYEQGLPREWADLPIGGPPSLGIHESQSRLWENQVARSRPFTDFLLPQLKERFPEQIGMVLPEDFYGGVNHPRRTLIRVTADELTYNLHVGFRFELELALFRDELSVSDLPAAWDDKMSKHLGLSPDSVADGVLQDMHWSIGSFGYFPTYTLGTIYSAVLYAQATEQLPGLEAELRSGVTDRLLEWLRENVHGAGYMHDAKDLIERVGGGPITAEPLLDYLRAKYTGLYPSA